MDTFTLANGIVVKEFANTSGNMHTDGEIEVEPLVFLLWCARQPETALRIEDCYGCAVACFLKDTCRLSHVNVNTGSVSLSNYPDDGSEEWVTQHVRSYKLPNWLSRTIGRIDSHDEPHIKLSRVMIIANEEALREIEHRRRQLGERQQ